MKAWIVFADESGQSLRPPKARTWSRRGQTPKMLVSGKGSGRVNLAGMIAVRAGFHTRLIYRVLVNRGRKGEKKGFRERDLAGMLDAHQQLRGPIVLVWDSDTAHKDAAMQRLIAARDWLTVFYLPTYAPILNPVEGVWSVLKRSLGPFRRPETGRRRAAQVSGHQRVHIGAVHRSCTDPGPILDHTPERPSGCLDHS